MKKLFPALALILVITGCTTRQPDYVTLAVGNHDIEAGPAVYNKLTGELNFPWLAANAVDEQTGEPYFEPCTVLQAGIDHTYGGSGRDTPRNENATMLVAGYAHPAPYTVDNHYRVFN